MKKIHFILLLGFVTSSLQAIENPEAHLAKSLENIKTFQARFIQKIRDANGEPVGNSKGEVTIQRPGKFYWKSQSPDSIIVVADGRHLWTYDVELAQVTKQTLKETLKNSPAELLAGKIGTLEESFNIQYAKAKQCHKSVDTCYLLHPKQKDAAFSDILIGFEKDQIKEVKMHDPLGQEVHTFFSAIKINGSVNNSIFAFKTPKGVDLIQSGT